MCQRSISTMENENYPESESKDVDIESDYLS